LTVIELEVSDMECTESVTVKVPAPLETNWTPELKVFEPKSLDVNV
jgi:hypothetical protein